ncbi:ribose 5-phosphate isomerase [Cenarchaeum symbiosum A]|uniref:Ribose 5-phosphate isomerase A n=1 Tax=Cenarchaeum symbiosum (strain A) TaxID=414004 RepID=A0RTM4_CENSY|nr:ribose 5-phosphate isomerase [Cenarchaeum symbiosum A]
MTALEDAFRAISADALNMVKDGQVIGLGSGRAAAVLVRELASRARSERMNITGVPTSLQIRLVAEECGISLRDPGDTDKIDIVFDGADQVDRQGNLIKGGGGALLTESILIGMADKVVIIADESKFAEHLDAPVPVEVHPAARRSAAESVMRLGGKPVLRLLDRGFPLFTENRNLVLDCSFGTITDPSTLRDKLTDIPGVAEAGIITRRPDTTYRAKTDGGFDAI